MSIGYLGKTISISTLTQKKVGDEVVVYIAEHPSTVALVTGRATVGMGKRVLYQRGLASTLSAHWYEVAEKENVLQTSIPVVALLRGGNYIIPPNLQSIMDNVAITGIGLKIQRFIDAEGSWRAKVDVSGSYGLEKLKGANVVMFVDECGASGSTPFTGISWLREYVPTLRKVIFVCPLLGDIAVEKVASVGFPVSIFSFGIFKVLQVGWKKTVTDIVVPEKHDGSNLIAIPDMVWQGCKQVYGFGENGCCGCVAGDATNTMSENTNVLIAELAEAGEWWCARNGRMPPPEIWSGLTGLLSGVPNLAEHIKQKAFAEMLALLRDNSYRQDRTRCLDMFHRQQELWRVIHPETTD